MVDLGQYSEINAMSIQWESACSDDYDIQVSSDKNNWITVKDSMATGSSLLDEYNFDEPVYGRYVRVSSHKSSTIKYGISKFLCMVLIKMRILQLIKMHFQVQ